MNIEAEQRAAVVAEAWSWMLTPYHHNARVKGVGVDCAQLPIACYAASGLIPDDLDPIYSPQWHLHRSEEKYVDWVMKFAREITDAELQPGDLTLWKWGRTYSHGGVVVGTDLVIHSYIGVGVQLDNVKIHSELSSRDARHFSIWGQ